MDTFLNKVRYIEVTRLTYYTAGAYICKRIEEKFGRSYLAELVPKGGLQFIIEYNALVPTDFKISLVDF